MDWPCCSLPLRNIFITILCIYIVLFECTSRCISRVRQVPSWKGGRHWTAASWLSLHFWWTTADLQAQRHARSMQWLGRSQKLARKLLEMEQEVAATLQSHHCPPQDLEVLPQHRMAPEVVSPQAALPLETPSCTSHFTPINSEMPNNLVRWANIFTIPILLRNGGNEEWSPRLPTEHMGEEGTESETPRLLAHPLISYTTVHRHGPISRVGQLQNRSFSGACLIGGSEHIINKCSVRDQ